MTLYSLLTVRDAARFGAYLTKLGIGRDKKVTIDFGVQDHCFMADEVLTPAELNSLNRMDVITFQNFDLDDVEEVFDNMTDIVEHPIAESGRSFFFEGFRIEDDNPQEITVTFLWGS
jgi:hypothetical protein